MELLFFFLFCCAVIVSFFLPGLVILQIFTSDEKPSIQLLLALPIGISIFLLASYFLAWIQLPYLVLLIPILSLIYFLYKRDMFLTFFKQNIDWVNFIFIFLGSLFFTSMTFLSGRVTAQGMPFYAVNAIDGLVHVALIKNMTFAFPPHNPSLADNFLRGYHYFYDFLASRFVLFYHFSAEDIQFRFFPFLLSIVYGLSFILLTQCFTKRKIAQYFVLFFAYFGQSFGFLFFFFTGQSNNGVSLGLPFSSQLILDPSVVLSIPILFVGLYYLLQEKTSLKTAFLAGLCLGIVCQIKVYTGLIAIGVIVLFACYDILYKRKNYIWHLVLLSITAILTAGTFLPNNLGAGSLTFMPFLSYRHFVEQPIFQHLQWDLQLQIFQQHNNYLHIIFLYIEAIGIFWILALGIRIVSLAYIGKLFHTSFWHNEKHVLFLLLCCVTLFWGSFFIQTVSVFDIMQFFWIYITFISIPTGIIYATLWEKKFLALRIFLLVILLGFSLIPTSNRIDQGLFTLPATIYTPQQIAFYTFVRDHVAENSFIIVIPPYPQNGLTDVSKLNWYRAPQVAALTGRSTYYEPAIAYYHIYNNLYATRQQTTFHLAKLMENCNVPAIMQLLQTVGSSSIVSNTPYNCIGSTQKIKTTKEEGGLYFYQF